MYEYIMICYASEPASNLTSCGRDATAFSVLQALRNHSLVRPVSWWEEAPHLERALTEIPASALHLVYRRRGRFDRSWKSVGPRYFEQGLTVIGEVPAVGAKLAVEPVRVLQWAGLPVMDPVREACRRWPRLVAHIISESLGYCTPARAAWILLDAKAGRRNYCEWVSSCYRGDAREVVRQSIRARASHRGYMADVGQASRIVGDFSSRGREPMLASWF